MNTSQPITIKATRTALQLLRLIAAATGEKQYLALERILRAEWAKLDKGLPR